MKRLMMLFAGAFLVASFPSPSAAQDTSLVQGRVTGVAGTTLIVRVKGKDMTFTVDAKTSVIAPGATTRARAAQAAGNAAPTLADNVKVGQPVEVRYHEQGMHAASVRVLPSAPGPRSETARGVVSAVSNSSLTLKSAGGEWTFTIDRKTMVIGPGLGTKTRQMASLGAKTKLTDFVAIGDTVTVKYRQMNGTNHASEVRVTKKEAAP